jgi:Tol biopolymer transport system component
MWAALVAAILLAPAPDSTPPPSRIMFASARTGVAQLYSVEPSGDGLAQVTFGVGNWGFPAPSPDGRFVAAFRGPDLWLPYSGALVQAPRPELWVMQADGSGARLLSPYAVGASWSGDSRRLVFIGADGDIRTVAVPGGRPQRLPRVPYGTSPTPSPDGRSIAFFRADRFGVMHVVVRRSGRERVIARGLTGQIVWSPNGKWIAIHGRDTLSVVRSKGGAVHVFSAVPTICLVGCVSPAVAWSPDSRRLAFETTDGIELATTPFRGGSTLLVKGGAGGIAWSPRGDAIVFGGVKVATLGGQVARLLSFGVGEALPGIGWSPGRPELHYRAPEETPPLQRVSGRELEARFPIRQLSADGDRVAYWLCPHGFGAWRPGEAPVALGAGTLAACRVPAADRRPESNVYDLTLASDRLAYLTASGGNTSVWQLWLTTLEGGDEGVAIASGSQTTGDEARFAQLEDLVGGGSALVFGRRGWTYEDYRHPESVWRVDGATPVQVASRSDDLQPLAVDGGRIVARRTDGSLELLSLDGHVLETFDVPSLGAAIAGDDLVVLVQGALRDYRVSSGELLHAWPLPDVPSAGRCRISYCAGIRLTLDDAARGVVVYTLDGVVHLLRVRDGADATVPGATAAELTDAGLFYAYRGEEPWPGRIRFVPFDELPF